MGQGYQPEKLEGEPTPPQGGSGLMQRDHAKQDKTVSCRNPLGHWEDCPYWDWADFSKCDCAQGLANQLQTSEAMAVTPMPLRDFIAAMIPIPWEDAMGIAAKENEKRIALGGGLTLTEILDARARLRYMEADLMVHHRRKPPKRFEDQEAEEEPSPLVSVD